MFFYCLNKIIQEVVRVLDVFIRINSVGVSQNKYEEAYFS